MSDGNAWEIAKLPLIIIAIALFGAAMVIIAGWVS